MKALSRLTILLAAFITGQVLAADPAPWPALEKTAAIAGCRMSIKVSAERDYMKRSNVTELPRDFQEKIAPAIEPYLASCDCMIGEFEKRWTYQDFLTRQNELHPEIRALMKSKCALPQLPAKIVPLEKSK